MEADDDISYQYYIFLNMFSFIIYLAYIELSPKLGNIWLRKDAAGIRRLSLWGLKDFLLYPLKQYRVWHPMLWDLNVFVSVPLISFNLDLIKKYLYR